MGGFIGPNVGLIGSVWNAITDTILAAVEVVLARAILALSAAIEALVKAVQAIVRTVNAINSLLLGFLFVISDLWNRMKSGFAWVVGLRDFFSGLFGRLRDLARVLFEGGWKQIIPKILDVIRRIRARLAAMLQPLINYLRHLRAFWDFYFRVYVRPLLNLIQRVRQVLLIFRIFHLKFAAQLDKRLAALESDIAGLFLDTRRQINRLLNYVNLILDPAGLFQVDTYLKTVARSVGELFSLIHAVQMRELFSSELDQVADNKRAEDLSSARKNADRFIETGVPPWDAADYTPGEILKQAG